MNKPCLIAQNISLMRHALPLLHDISFTLEAGSVTSLMGHNGAGKTLLLSALHGLINITSGTIEMTKAPSQKMVFQKPVLMRRSAQSHFAFATDSSDKQLADKWFETARLSHRRQTSARHLSSGEAQKLALISALATMPDILFADEPTANLDSESRLDVERLLLQARQSGTAILLVTHSLAQAKRLSDNILFLEKGSLLDDAPAESFFAGKRSASASIFLENL